MQHITQIGLRDPVHTNPEKFESEALFLPSIFSNPSRKRSLSKTLIKSEEFENVEFAFIVDEKHFDNDFFFRNDAWCHDNQVICDCCVVKPLRGSVDKNYLMRF